MMKRKLRGLLTAAFALVATVLWAEGGQPCVVVEQTDGTRTAYLLADQPRVSYDGAVVRLVSSRADVELAVADVKRVYLSESMTTGVGERSAVCTVRVSMTADGISMSGLEPGSAVSVASIDGRRLSGGHATDDGSLRLPLSNVPGGVIVVRTSKQSFKLIRK